MAKVTLKGLSFQKTYSKDITGRLFADLVSDGLGTNKTLTNDYNKHLEEVAKRLPHLTARKINSEAKLQYNGAISAVQAFLKTGVPGSPDGVTLNSPGTMTLTNPSASVGVGRWKPFSHRYYKYKGKEFSKTKNLFWVRRSAGGLSAKFGAFAGRHKGAVTRTETVVTLQSRGKKNVGRATLKVFRYALTFELPTPFVGQGYFKELLQESFVSGVPYKGDGYGLSGGLEVLGYLEGTPHTKFAKHRPFIARVMASKGRTFNKKMTKLIKTQAL